MTTSHSKPIHGLIDGDLEDMAKSLERASIRDIPGFEGLYQITGDGRVFSCDRYEYYKGRWGFTKRKRSGRRIKDWDCEGYRQVMLYKGATRKHFNIHRLVAMTFIPNPDNLPEVNHIDEDRTNNCVDNLEWTDRSGNALHSVHKFTGSNSGTAVLDEASVFDIKRLIEDGYDNHTIASWYEVDHSTISKIRTGKNWKHVK